MPGAAFLTGSSARPQKRDASDIAATPSPPTRGRSTALRGQRQRTSLDLSDRVKELEDIVATFVRQRTEMADAIGRLQAQSFVRKQVKGNC